MFKEFIKKWRQYRYRFVPWISLNLKERSVREVKTGEHDKIIPDEQLVDSLLGILHALFDNEPSSRTTHHLNVSQHHEEAMSMDEMYELYKPRSFEDVRSLHMKNMEKLYDTTGFVIDRCPSQLIGGGRGVAVTRGKIPKHSLVALYPGTLYQPQDPILFQSINNPFIFRCIDGLLIDGNDSGLSKFIFKSCHGRERIGPFYTCDMSWLTDFPINPLGIGQYINNRSNDHPANVAYQEVDLGDSLQFHLRQYIPHAWYQSPGYSDYRCRTVALVSLRDISEDEELFSSYFTVVH
ncbi:unnamed protein product [Owenia fusiformis]|uniref:Uncharacterized protein n=1 Tax=Owenia fusiformis TaxID=6347 RepID=A0A8J1XQQ9_OWEFU|nr:unnamed protein product [Owenia fusiformis]